MVLKQTIHAVQKIQSDLWICSTKYIMEFSFSNAAPEFIFLPPIEADDSNSDSFNIYQKTNLVQNLSFIISWIHFSHKTLCQKNVVISHLFPQHVYRMRKHHNQELNY